MKYVIWILLLLTPPVLAQTPMSLDDAIALALTNNPELRVERESVVIADSLVNRARAAWEPHLRGDLRLRDRTDPVNSILSGAPRGELAPEHTTVQASSSVVRLLPGGATVGVSAGLGRESTDSVLALLTPAYTSFAGVEFRQPLLQNRRIDPARRALRVALVERDRAGNSVERIAVETIASVERAYWALVTAQRETEARASTLSLAERQHEDTGARVEGGVQPESDLAATAAEIERRRLDVRVAAERRERAENALKALVTSSADDPLWAQPLAVDALEAPDEPGQQLDDAIAEAIRVRAEVAEARSRHARLDVEAEFAHDRLRPQVDLVASYAARGLAGERNAGALPLFGSPVIADPRLTGGVDDSLENLAGLRFPDASVGVSVSIPLRNTAAREDLAVIAAQRRQLEAQLDAVERRIGVEVRNAHAALRSARQRIEMARAAKRSAAVQLEAEQAKLEAGVSSTFLILTRQNDLLQAELAEISALSDLRLAQAEAARAGGRLLEDRGVRAEAAKRSF